MNVAMEGVRQHVRWLLDDNQCRMEAVYKMHADRTRDMQAQVAVYGTRAARSKELEQEALGDVARLEAQVAALEADKARLEKVFACAPGLRTTLRNRSDIDALYSEPHGPQGRASR
jgi:hypothetical protein